MKAADQWGVLSWMITGMIALVLAACGVAVGWWWAQPDGRQAETPELPQRQSDNSLILERRPDPAARPRQRIPPGAKVERLAQVTVQPDAPPPSADKPCPPVTVDLSLIREPDGAHRVLASSPDGQVVGGIDVPVAPVPATPRQWAAGLSWSPITRTSGVWLERDVRIPLLDVQARVGVDVRQAGGVQASAQGVDGLIRIGIAF